ncbi:MAG: hypothetical protein QXU18_13105 [Thermoplasmatales archaeon]
MRPEEIKVQYRIEMLKHLWRDDEVYRNAEKEARKEGKMTQETSENVVSQLETIARKGGSEHETR